MKISNLKSEENLIGFLEYIKSKSVNKPYCKNLWLCFKNNDVNKFYAILLKNIANISTDTGIFFKKLINDSEEVYDVKTFNGLVSKMETISSRPNFEKWISNVFLASDFDDEETYENAFEKAHKNYYVMNKIDLLWCYRKFNEFNEMFFDGKIPAIPIKQNRTKSAFAQFYYYLNADGTTKNWEIRISNRFKSNTVKDLEEHLIHEMIHAYLCIVAKKPREGHGPLFVSKMNEINRTSDYNITIKGYGDDKRSQLYGDIKPFLILKTQMNDLDNSNGIMTYSLNKMNIISKSNIEKFILHDVSKAFNNNCNQIVFTIYISFDDFFSNMKKTRVPTSYYKINRAIDAKIKESFKATCVGKYLSDFEDFDDMYDFFRNQIIPYVNYKLKNSVLSKYDNETYNQL